MKKVFRTHIVLATEGRIFTLLILLFALGVTYVSAWLLTEGYTEMIFTFFVLHIIAYGCGYMTLRWAWQLAWGKIILTDSYIMWRCLFFKPVKIAYSDIRHIEKRAFKEGNVYKNRDYYKTGFLYFLVSSEPIPQKRIDKIYSGKKLIKFPLYNKKLGYALYSMLPEPYNRYFSDYRKYEKLIKNKK